MAVVDPVAKKQYRAVIDSKDRPLSSALPPTIDGPGPSTPAMTYLAWVRFPAPPESANTMEVVFPNGGARISAVDTTSGPALTPTPGPQVVPATPAPFDKAPDSTDTAGLKLPVLDLVSTIGNPAGSDAESPGLSTLTLNADVLFEFAKADLSAASRSSSPKSPRGSRRRRPASSPSRAIPTPSGPTRSTSPCPRPERRAS